MAADPQHHEASSNDLFGRWLAHHNEQQAGEAGEHTESAEDTSETPSSSRASRRLPAAAVASSAVERDPLIGSRIAPPSTFGVRKSAANAPQKSGNDLDREPPPGWEPIVMRSIRKKTEKTEAKQAPKPVDRRSRLQRLKARLVDAPEPEVEVEVPQVPLTPPVARSVPLPVAKPKPTPAPAAAGPDAPAAPAARSLEETIRAAVPTVERPVARHSEPRADEKPAERTVEQPVEPHEARHSGRQTQPQVALPVEQAAPVARQVEPDDVAAPRPVRAFIDAAPVTAPEPEPVAVEPEPYVAPEPVVAEPEAVAESVVAEAEPEPLAFAESVVAAIIELEPTKPAGPTEDQPQFSFLSKSRVVQAEPAAVVAPVVEPVVEPVAEPVVEPVIEPVIEAVAEPVVQPVIEPVDRGRRRAGRRAHRRARRRGRRRTCAGRGRHDRGRAHQACGAHCAHRGPARQTLLPVAAQAPAQGAGAGRARRAGPRHRACDRAGHRARRHRARHGARHRDRRHRTRHRTRIEPVIEPAVASAPVVAATIEVEPTELAEPTEPTEDRPAKRSFLSLPKRQPKEPKPREDRHHTGDAARDLVAAKARARATSPVAEPVAQPAVQSSAVAVEAPPEPEAEHVKVSKHDEVATEMPGVYKFAAKRTSRRLLTIALLIGLIATAYFVRAAVEIKETPAIGLAAIVVLATVMVWAIRSGASVTMLEVHQGQLQVIQQGGRFIFDLSSQYTRFEVHGEPGHRGWKVLFPRRGMAPFTVDASMVDPDDFMRVLRFFRPQLVHH